MIHTLNHQLTLETIECGGCGMVFAVPQEWKKKKVADHGDFKCPNGCSRRFIAKTEAEKYKEQLEEEQRAAATLREQVVVAEHAQKKAERKLKNHEKRAAAGVCPCCNRTVAQLAAHMKSKHSDYMELQGLAIRKQLPEKVQ